MADEDPRLDLGVLIQAALVARSSRTAVPAEIEEILGRLQAAGPPHADLARFLVQLASGDEPPEVPPGLAPDVARALEQVREAVSGDTGALMEVVEAAFEARAGGALSDDHRATLEAMREQGSPHAEVGDYLLALAEGREAVVPADLDPDAREFLGQVAERLERIERGGRSVDELVDAALEARVTGEPLAPELKAFLTRMQEAGPPHAGFADFVDAVADRSALPPEVPSGLPGDVARVLTGVRAAIVSQAVLTEVVEGVLAARGRAPLSTRHREYLEDLQGQGSPHRDVAGFLLAVAEGSTPGIPADLPDEAREFLEGILARLTDAEA